MDAIKPSWRKAPQLGAGAEGPARSWQKRRDGGTAEEAFRGRNGVAATEVTAEFDPKWGVRFLKGEQFRAMVAADLMRKR